MRYGAGANAVDGNRIGLLLHGGTLNLANLIVSNKSEHGILLDDVEHNYPIRHFNFWNPEGANYGNISADRRDKDPEQGNCRLDYGSPAINPVSMP